MLSIPELKIRNNKSLPCKKCGTIMCSILSYEVREVCEPCGGKASLEYDFKSRMEELLTLRRERLREQRRKKNYT